MRTHTHTHVDMDQNVSASELPSELIMKNWASFPQNKYWHRNQWNERSLMAKFDDYYYYYFIISFVWYNASTHFQFTLCRTTKRRGRMHQHLRRTNKSKSIHQRKNFVSIKWKFRLCLCWEHTTIDIYLYIRLYLTVWHNNNNSYVARLIKFDNFPRIEFHTFKHSIITI